MFRTPKWFALTLAILLVSSLAFGQTTRGSIAGVVTDSQGAVVTGAKVTATPLAGGEPRSTTTGPNGEYRLDALNPGNYNIDVQAQGFSDTKVQNVIVRTSLVSSNNVQLSIKSTSESVVVEANVDQIQTESGELAKSIPSVQIKDLPIPTGNPFSLAVTLPGVVTVNARDDFTNGASFAVNGLRPRANNFLIDGFDNNDNGIGGQAYQPVNQEAVQEVTVLTNSYAAEFGRGGASVSNLTFRSGSNALHGGGWWSYDGSALDALTTEQANSGYTRQPQYTNNTLGFRIGGPVIKNKLFFFGTSQWNHVLGANPFASTLVLPTQNGVNALNSIQVGGGTTSLQNVQYLVNSLGSLRGLSDTSFVNVGNRAGCGSPCLIEVGSVNRFDPVTNKNREWTVRTDISPTSSDNIFLRYTDSYQSASPDLFANPAALPTMDTLQQGPARILGLMWAHTLSSSMLNEFRFSGQQINFTFAPTAATLAQPTANVPTFGLATSFGANTTWGGFEQGAFPQGRGHRTYQWQDALSLNRGTHNMKFGVDLTYLQVHDVAPFNSKGFIIVSGGGSCAGIGLATCTDLANYIDDFSGGGNGAQFGKNYGSPRINVNTLQQAYYFQDSWRVKSNFTLDYGVRYEYQPPDAANVLAFPAVNRATALTDPFLTRHQVKSDRNNFGPRVGFAYTPQWGKRIFGDGKTVIRGGAGMFYDVFFTNIADNTATTSPNAAGGTTFPGAALGRGVAGVVNATVNFPNTTSPLNAITTQLDDLKNPQIFQWNLNVQRELPGRFVFETAYVGTRGTRLWLNEDLNFGDYRLGANNSTRLNTAKGQINARTNSGDSVYHGWQSTLSRNIGRLSLRGSYTWSRSIDNKSEVFVSSEGSSRWAVPDDPRSDRGPSAFHRTHRAAITWVYEFPQFKGHGFLTPILGGWASSGQVGFQSGAPQTIYIGGFDQNGDFNGFNDRPFLSNPRAAINYSDACINDPACISGVGLDLGGGTLVDLNTGASGTADQFRYIINVTGDPNVIGNVGRNSFYAPGIQTWNLSAFKRFYMPYKEGHVVEFRADFFNAFNHPNTGVINLADIGNTLDSNFLNLDHTRSGGRNITLWLKYTF
jgi:hypothetical protein